jgi:hypothetical protein
LTSQDREYVFDNINENAVPTGFTLIVPEPSAAEKQIPIILTLTPNPQSSTPQAETEATIEGAIVAYFATVPPGGEKAASFHGIFLSTLDTVIRNAAGVAVLNAVIDDPAADVALLSVEIPVLFSFAVVWTT